MKKHCYDHQNPDCQLKKNENHVGPSTDGLLPRRRTRCEPHDKLEHEKCDEDQERPVSKFSRRIQAIQCGATTQEPNRIVTTQMSRW